MKLKNRIDDALENADINLSRKKALNSIRKNYISLANQINLDLIKNRFRSIRKKAISNISELIELASSRLRENGCKVYNATSVEDVYKILDVLITDSIVVKCKTNTSKEIKLKSYLKSRNIEVIETDLGDRIVQLSKTSPSHPLIPSLHIPKAQAAKLFNLNGDPSQITITDIIEVARKGIREYVLAANIGISGANAITAEEGFICLEENEGNQRLITSLTRKHIVLAGIEKIVPTAEDALHVMKSAALGLASRSGVYLSFISGPSKTGDIDFELTFGMHGPSEVHVILIDNGRRDLIENRQEELLYCANCGNCANFCPVYEEVGDVFGADAFLSGRGLLYLAQTKGINFAFENGLNYCTGCQACTVVCPGSIDIYNAMIESRFRATKQNLCLPVHQKMVESINQNNNPFHEPLSKRSEWLSTSFTKKTNTLLFLGCMASYRMQNQAKTTLSLLNYLKIPFTYLGSDEPCCGSVLRNCGYTNQFQDVRSRCLRVMQDFSEIITICPGCYSTFKSSYANYLQENDINVRHLIEILPEYTDKFKKPKTKITYHDPCHLGRHSKLYTPPRLLFNNIQEMDYTMEYARCCGAGAGVMSAFPNLSRNIAQSRIEDALRTDAETLITSCPFCAYNLSHNSKSNLIQVQSVQEFLVENLLKL